VEEKQCKHELRERVINKALTQTYFDGASQGNPPKGGTEGFYISPPHTISPSKPKLAKNITISLK